MGRDKYHAFVRQEEVQSYIDRGYQNGGISFSLMPLTDPTLDKIYYLSSPFRSVLVTTNSERDQLIAAGYTLSPVSFSLGSTVTPKDVFRLMRNGSWLLTTSPTERQDAITKFGFADESIAFKQSDVPANALMPIYRITKDGRHIFLSSRAERDLAIINFDFLAEGIAFYAPPNTSSLPVTQLGEEVRRLMRQNGNRLYTTSPQEATKAVSDFGFTLEANDWRSLR